METCTTSPTPMRMTVRRAAIAAEGAEEDSGPTLSVGLETS